MPTEVNRTSLALLFAVVAIILFVFYAAAAVFDQNVNLGLGLAALTAALVIA